MLKEVSNSNNYTALVNGKVVHKENGRYKATLAVVVFKDGIIYDIKTIKKSEEAILYVKLRYGDNAEIILLPDNHMVFPGFMDLHSHFDYNMFPLWDNPHEPVAWDNRHEWRKCSEYARDIKDMYKLIKDNWGKRINGSSAKLGDVFQFFSELQAIAGGTTVLQEPSEIDEELYRDLGVIPLNHMLLRSTSVSSDLGLPEDGKIYSVVDFLKPAVDHVDVKPPQNTETWNLANTKEFDFYVASLKKNDLDSINGYLVHLAEGRFGKPFSSKTDDDFSTVDAYSAKEFNLLCRQLIAVPGYVEKVKRTKLTIIHGCGVDFGKFGKFILDCGINFVWSPVSNLLLYKTTPDFYKLFSSHIHIALGSDWSPSGSKHVWDECKFAYRYLQKYAKEKDNLEAQVLDMITANPATILGAPKLGSISVGKFADFFILEDKDGKFADHPVQLLLNKNDSVTKAVVIDGKVIYIDVDLYEKLPQSFKSDCYQRIPQSEGTHSARKYVYVPQKSGIKLDRDIEMLNALFKKKGQIRSKFLSSDDAEYQRRMEKLLKDFC